jgi:hypothetical protein
VGPFSGCWTFLRRTSTNIYWRIKVNPFVGATEMLFLFTSNPAFVVARFPFLAPQGGAHRHLPALIPRVLPASFYSASVYYTALRFKAPIRPAPASRKQNAIRALWLPGGQSSVVGATQKYMGSCTSGLPVTGSYTGARPLHNRLTRTGTCVCWGIAVSNSRYKFEPFRFRNRSETATWIQNWFKIPVGTSRKL